MICCLQLILRICHTRRLYVPVLDLLKSKQGSKRDSSANESLTKNMPVSHMKVYLELMPTRRLSSDEKRLN